MSEIAASLAVSRFQLSRIFRECTSFSLLGYRNQLRVRAALDRLSDPNARLSALAGELGYSNPSHLTAAFRDAFGFLPSELRGPVNRDTLSEVLVRHSPTTNVLFRRPPAPAERGGASGAGDRSLHSRITSFHQSALLRVRKPDHTEGGQRETESPTTSLHRPCGCDSLRRHGVRGRERGRTRARRAAIRHGTYSVEASDHDRMGSRAALARPGVGHRRDLVQHPPQHHRSAGEAGRRPRTGPQPRRELGRERRRKRGLPPTRRRQVDERRSGHRRGLRAGRGSGRSRRSWPPTTPTNSMESSAPPTTTPARRTATRYATQSASRLWTTGTLEVKLTSAQPWFVQQVSHHSSLAVPRATVEQYGDSWTNPRNIVTDDRSSSSLGSTTLRSTSKERGVALETSRSRV